MMSVFLALSFIDIYADLFKINEYDTDGFLLKPTLSNLFDILTLKDSDVQSVSAKREDAIKAFKIFFAEAVKFFIETVKEYWLTSKRWRILKFLIARGAPFDPNTDGDAIFSCLVEEMEQTRHISLPLDSERDIFDDLLDLGYGTSEIEIFGDLESLFDEIYTIQPESVNSQDNKSRAPLSYAVESRNLEGVELLLRYGADVQDDDELGQTALHTLCSQDTTYKEPSGYFGYETRYRGDGPWYCVISNSEVKKDLLILKQLESASINLNSRTKSLATPLATALQHQRPSFILQFLNILQRRNKPKEYHFSVILSCDVDHRNILHYAVDRGGLRCDEEQMGLIEVIKTIFTSLSEKQQQFLLTGQDLSSGFTPLHAAASQGYIHLIKFFLHYRSDVKLESIEGFPAIHYLVSGRVFEKAMTSECFHRQIPATETSTVHRKARDVIGGENVLVLLLGDIQGTEKYVTMFANLQCLALQGNWEELYEMLNTRGVDPLYDDDNGWNKHHMEAVYNGVWNESTKPTPYMGPLPAPSMVLPYDYYKWTQPIAKLTRNYPYISCIRISSWQFRVSRAVALLL
ncbi:hypothetical protein TWF132_004229 [Orbilia oligospora]|nr:hypothetical protein TWF128_004197 [Orbilia oligospora]KAF3298091.1 hypothetical protein TWF132_004229 [Orbilia oligospora]